MEIIDTHCDVLAKIYQLTNDKKHVSFKHYPLLQVNKEKMKKGNIKIQFFAIFIHPDVPDHLKWAQTLTQIHLFHEKIIEPNADFVHIKNWQDIDQLQQNEVGAVLTIEGADMIGNDLIKAHHLRRLGVLSIGLTWNKANLFADGVLESRGAGLTEQGKQMIKFHNEHDILTDVTHISDRGFNEIIEIANMPYASHSNSRTICNHPRNLTDEQAKKLFNKQSMIHVNFYPRFLTEDKSQATITDIIRHLDHLCSIGGEDYVGFGSDFDGIDEVTKGISDSTMYPHLIERLLKHFSTEQVKKFTSKNFLQFIQHFKKPNTI